MQALDPRIIKVSIEVNGIVKTYENVTISATGTKYANALQNEAEVKITNYDTVTNEFLITQTTPFNKNKTPKVLTLYAGRQSYGVSRVFTGNIADAKIARGDSQPDQVLTLKCLTGNYKKGFLVSNTQPGLTNLSTVAKQVADNLDLGLEFHAKDSDVANYTYSGLR
jgi:hypothetical protein